MDIKIEGNPGTGNSFCEYHINEVKTLAPQATTVTNTIINNHYGDRKPVRTAPSEAEEKADLVQRQQGILAYVCRLKPFVAPAWKNRYESTWRSILALPEVAAQVYEPGKQKDTAFNRNLVANIIYIMYNGHDGHGIIAESNATHLAEILEGDKDHSVRRQLGLAPDDREITEAVNKLLNMENQ